MPQKWGGWNRRLRQYLCSRRCRCDAARLQRGGAGCIGTRAAFGTPGGAAELRSGCRAVRADGVAAAEAPQLTEVEGVEVAGFRVLRWSGAGSAGRCVSALPPRVAIGAANLRPLLQISAAARGLGEFALARMGEVEKVGGAASRLVDLPLSLPPSSVLLPQQLSQALRESFSGYPAAGGVETSPTSNGSCGGGRVRLTGGASAAGPARPGQVRWSL